EDKYQDYLNKKIMRTASHQEFITLNDDKHLKNLIADPETGYATGLKRN
ncbi:MAG: CoA transferase subunit A, partial [Candidatus Latescibacterota bacterium]